MLTDNEMILYMAGCTLARVPGNNNWLEEKQVGGLPEYICRIARAIHRGDASKSISQVIAIAVSRAKVWARGGGGVTAKTQAKAAKAVAEWERKKVAAKADNVKTSYAELEDIKVLLTADLTTNLTDTELEKATAIPCTEKVNRSLVENIALTKAMQQEREMLLSFSADKPHLLRLIQGE